MSSSWFLFSVFAPPILAVAAHLVFRSRTLDPAFLVMLNGLMPGAGLAAACRPLVEVVLGVLMAQLGMLVSAGPDLAMLIPIGMIGAAWAVVHTPWNPLTAQGLPRSMQSPTDPTRAVQPLQRAVPARTPITGEARKPVGSNDDETSGEIGYAVTVCCTECGAKLEVSVLHHAAQCEYCGSHHLVVGHEDVLQVAIPERISQASELREIVLDHLRYVHYLKLYQRSVAPLEQQATLAGPTGGLAVSSDVEAASIAAERTISLKADHYRAKLAKTLTIPQTQHFLTPYFHATGTLYQGAFGRDQKSQDKKLCFTLDNLELSVSGQESVEVPTMGKLSYLKALIPAAQLRDDVRVVPPAADQTRLDTARGDLNRKQLDRSLQTIRLGSAFSEDARAVVWRPWWVAHVEGPKVDEILLIDSAGGSVAGTGSFVNPDLLEPLPEQARDVGATLKFQPMQCPTCGYEFRYETDAVLHFCLNCHRLFDADESGKTEIKYDHSAIADAEESDLVPFWRFPLRLQTSDGQLITDLRHLRDGIDGTFDQIGDDTASRQDSVWIPAIRCINPRLMTKAFNHLFVHLWKHPPAVVTGRYSLEDKVHPWPISLQEPEVRALGPLFLTNAFGPRDIARVNVHQVGAWLFDGRFEAHGRLVYAPIPKAVTAPFRDYLGRSQSKALKDARQGCPS